MQLNCEQSLTAKHIDSKVISRQFRQDRIARHSQKPKCSPNSIET